MKTNQSQINSPHGWKETKLTDIGLFSKGSGITKDQLTKTGHNAIRYGELYTRFDFKIEKIYSFIPTDILPTTTKIKYGDILLAGSGETNEEIGKSASYLLHADCYAGGDLIIFSPKNANSLFISYFLNIGEGRKKLTRLGQGQSVVHIYKSEIEKLKLHLPPLPEQNRIVSVLETWDKTIEKFAQKIEVKKQIKKGLMQELLTGKKRLSGFTEKWVVVRFGDVVARIKRKNIENNQNVLTISGTKGLVSQSEIFYKRIASNNLENYSLLRRGDFAYNKSYSNGYPMGAIKRLKKYDSGVVSSLYITFEAKKINADFLDFYFENGLFNKALSMVAQEGARNHGLLNIGVDDFLSGDIYVPATLTEQEAVANILNTTDKEIHTLEYKLKVLKDQKKYLLNNLVTGTIRTPETLSIPK